MADEIVDSTEAKHCYSTTSLTAEGEDALSIVEDQNVLNRIQQHQNGHEVVSVTKQTVYESHADTNLPQQRNSFVGDDDSADSVFSLYIAVFKDSSNNYYVYATGDWRTGLNTNGLLGQDVGYDLLSVTWGGDHAFRGVDETSSGGYADSSSFYAVKAEADAYSGYCWRFFDLKGNRTSGSRLEYIDCYVKLERVNATLQGKETGVNVTYIHTYEETNLSISFQLTGEGHIPTVTLNDVDKQVPYATTVAGLTY